MQGAWDNIGQHGTIAGQRSHPPSVLLISIGISQRFWDRNLSDKLGWQEQATPHPKRAQS